MTRKITHICPSFLVECEGTEGYSKKALQLLFDGEEVSHKLPYKRFDDNDAIDVFISNSKRVSLSGVQIKYSVVLDNQVLRLPY